MKNVTFKYFQATYQLIYLKKEVIQREPEIVQLVLQLIISISDNFKES